MPTFVRTEKCDGCKGQDRTACMTNAKMLEVAEHKLGMLKEDA